MNKTLEELRKEIDTIDANIVEMLGRRMEVVKEVGKLKKDLNKQILDEHRWQTVLTKIKQHAEKIHLDSSFIEHIYTLIHAHALELEDKE